VVLFGEAARFLEETLTKEGYARVRTCVDLAEALEKGLAASLPGDVLLFSPACASFDQYTDAHARGEEFSRLVRAHASFTPPVPNR
jgi:UDP-N-acetylmuramoylalanine--D-glutamate ligase